MPTNEQVRKNIKEWYDIPHYDYDITAAHELGHILGLDDAYYDANNKIDRCADNDETGFKYGRNKYDNIMKNHDYCKKVGANDIEMMLVAYDKINGVSFFASQSYKDYKGHKFSEAIRNRIDYQEDKR